MEKEKKLAKNVIVFAIGSFSTKLLQFLLIPFYTRILTNSEYGTIDILQSIATLLIPIISLTISEAVFRYTMEKNSNKEEILSIGLLTNIITIIMMTGIAFIIEHLTKYEYILILVIYIATNIIRTIFSQFTRAIGKITIYTIDNVLTVLVTIVSNIVLLTILHKGIEGYLWGYVIGNGFSIFLLFGVVKLYQYISLKKVSRETFRKMLLFSIPLIPNSICWWIINFIDRLMITATYGSSTNGLYAVSHKIPTIITMIVEIFFQAWQISANEEFDNKNIGKFYTMVFQYLFSFVFFICVIMMTICKPLTTFLVGAEFIDSWYYMPTLLLSTAFFSMAQYLGSIYTASKNTKMAFFTNMTSAILNVCFNAVLLNSMGPIGAAISTTICYFILWIFRAIDTRKVVKIEYDFKRIIVTILLAVVDTILVTLQIKFWLLLSIGIVIAIVMINLKYMIGFMKSMIKLLQEKICSFIK